MHPKEIFLSNIKENNKIVYYEDFGYGTVRGERERESVCTITCRRANAAHALSIDDGFLNMATNLPISAPLRNMKSRSKNQLKKRKL